jgi:F-box interacting protein
MVVKREREKAICGHIREEEQQRESWRRAEFDRVRASIEATQKIYMADHFYDLLHILPEELLVEILIKLPPKSLLRCTSVCKPWYSLITSTRFIDTHLLLTNNVEKQVILYGVDPKKYYIRKDNEAFDEVSDFDPPFGDYIMNICSCNGLICMYGTGSERNVYLWNPSIKRLFRVPQPPVSWGTVGFGFVPETNDYKIVNVCGNSTSRKAGVYELGNGYWKDINNSEVFFAKYHLDYCGKQCFMNDTIHWVGRDETGNRWVILRFDVKKDELGVLMLPSSINVEHAWYLVPKSYQDSLALIQLKIDYGCSDFVIWVMNKHGVFESQRKLVTTDVNHFHFPILCRRNGEVLLTRRSMETDDFVSYDPKTQKIKDLGKTASKVLYADYFVESLVLLDK